MKHTQLPHVRISDDIILINSDAEDQFSLIVDSYGVTLGKSELLAILDMKSAIVAFLNKSEEVREFINK